MSRVRFFNEGAVIKTYRGRVTVNGVPGTKVEIHGPCIVTKHQTIKTSAIVTLQTSAKPLRKFRIRAGYYGAIVYAVDREAAVRFHPEGYIWDEKNQVWIHGKTKVKPEDNYWGHPDEIGVFETTDKDYICNGADEGIAEIWEEGEAYVG